MPTSVLEAIAFGLPIISTDVGAIPDFFEQGKMGYTFSQSVFVEKAISSIENLRKDFDLQKQIRLFNRNYGRQHFLASKVISEIDNLYTKIQ